MSQNPVKTVGGVILLAMLLWGCGLPLGKDAESLHEGMTRRDVDDLLGGRYGRPTQETGIVEVVNATRVFRPEVRYAQVERFSHLMEVCSVYFDSNDVIVAYNYYKAD